MELIRDRSPYFFIHIYKTMGTTIISQLPTKYQKRFYNYHSLKEWENQNNTLININTKKYYDKAPLAVESPLEVYDITKVAIDHLNIDYMFEIGILDELDLTRKFLAIIRDPIDRFLSICNYEDVAPEDLIKQIKMGRNISQISYLLTSKNINITIIEFNNKNDIIKWFKIFNVDINLLIIKNSSNKKYYLNENCKKFLINFFEKEYQLYNKLKNNNGVLEINSKEINLYV